MEDCNGVIIGEQVLSGALNINNESGSYATVHIKKLDSKQLIHGLDVPYWTQIEIVKVIDTINETIEAINDLHIFKQ